MTAYNGPNDPRFQQNSGFFEVIGLGAAAGSVAGYAAAWEAVGIYKTGSFLAPRTILAAIHAAGILPHAYLPILAGGVLTGAVAGAMAGWRAGATPHEIHIRGSQLTTRPGVMQAAIREASPPISGKNEGIRIHPRIQTTEHLETSHMLVLGGSGAGKTTILWPMVQQIVSRGDKCMIFSFKGDFEQKLDVSRFAILAPWDSRSATWALGKDIRTRLDAEALSMTLIPEPDGGSKDPMWVNGARALLVGIISDVQRAKGESWGFADLAKRAAEALSDFPTLKNIIATENPMAGALLSGGADSKTTASFLAVVASYLTHVINLGVGEDNLHNTQSRRREWSVNAWLAGDVPAVSILGFRSSAKGLSQAWGASIIEQIVQKCADLPDVSPDERRIWLILDEVPRLGKVPSITEALEVLRSKGVRLVLGAQGIGQIEEIYSKTTARSWAMQTATKIIGRIVEPDDQRWAANLIGERALERYTATQNTQSGGGQGGGGSSSGGSYQRVQEHVVLPGQFGQIVKVTRRGPRAILQVAGSDQVGLLDWPFASVKTLRPGRDEMQSPWVLPGYNRPVWGTVPPKIAEPTPAQPRPQPTPAQIAAAEGRRIVEEEAAARVRTAADALAAQYAALVPKPAAAATVDDSGGVGETVESAIADHVIGQALDAALTGGAGSIFEALKGYADLAAPTGGSVSAQVPPAQVPPESASSASPVATAAADADDEFAEP